MSSRTLLTCGVYASGFKPMMSAGRKPFLATILEDGALGLSLTAADS